MSCTHAQVIAARLSGLADTLTRNAAVLSGAGLPEVVTAVRAAVYTDVAAQLRLWIETDPQTAGNPLIVALVADDTAGVAAGVAREFEALAGLLAANARLLVRRTGDVVMRRRAVVYRDVAAQLRLLAADERQAAVAMAPQASRPPLSNTAPLSPIVLAAAVRAPRVRPEFLEPLIAAIAARRGRGWSVSRLSLWLRAALRDPQTDHMHPCADRSFVSYVTRLLAGPAHGLAAA
ncbi:hypothetical protein AB0F52_01580 [Amycolatopsis sp. NPDC024027]|uniref:hypothetical protein n=1 Tax=Amycolatopsis sp. NPDC024027 TaxID=3154327 RepID=UPI0033D2972B